MRTLSTNNIYEKNRDRDQDSRWEYERLQWKSATIKKASVYASISTRRDENLGTVILRESARWTELIAREGRSLVEIAAPGGLIWQMVGGSELAEVLFAFCFPRG